MHRIALLKRLTGLLVMLLLGITFALPAQAAPARQDGGRCLAHKHIDSWDNRAAIEARDFNFDIVGAQASTTFGHSLALDLASDPASSEYTASRLTEIDTWQPIDQRLKCWQATAEKNVVVEFRVRFDQPDPPPGLTENLILWNAPFPSTTPEPARPVTTIGASRTSALGAPQYIAVVTQDLDYATFTPPFVFRTMPMPIWLNAADWHRVRITVSPTTAQIEVAQNAHPFTTVLTAALAHPVEPLGFELSVDNEMTPGRYVPVTIPDGLDVDYLDMRLEHVQ